MSDQKDDKGGLAFSIYVSDKKIVMDFQKPIRWLGMTRQEAIALSKILKSQAFALELQERIENPNPN